MRHHTMEYSVIKKNELSEEGKIQIMLRYIFLSERSLFENANY